MDRDIPWEAISQAIRTAAARQDCPECGCQLSGAIAVIQLDESHARVGILCHCAWTRSAVVEITSEIIAEIEPSVPVPSAWKHFLS